MSRPSRCKASGFTLLEVLIALAVVAVALLAITRAMGQQAIASDVLAEQTLAGWVASNALTEFQLNQAWPEPGRSAGRARLGKRDWYWEIQVSNTDVERIRRIDVRVFVDAAREQGVADLSGFAGR